MRRTRESRRPGGGRSGASILLFCGSRRHPEPREHAGSTSVLPNRPIPFAMATASVDLLRGENFEPGVVEVDSTGIRLPPAIEIRVIRERLGVVRRILRIPIVGECNPIRGG